MKKDSLNKPVAAVFWSGGKDSYLALSVAAERFHVQYIVTTFDEKSRSHAHAFESSLFLEQSKSIGIELVTVFVSGSDYKEKIRNAVGGLTHQGVEHVIFGDIFLADLRRFREQLFTDLPIQVHFPLWKKSERELQVLFENQALQAVVTVVKENKLSKAFLGRLLGSAFFDDLPADVDAFGENGEYHTFCFGGRLFSYNLDYTAGKTTRKLQSFMTDGGGKKELSLIYLEIKFNASFE